MVVVVVVVVIVVVVVVLVIVVVVLAAVLAAILFVVILKSEFSAKFRNHDNSFLFTWIETSQWQVHIVQYEVFRAVVDTQVLEFRRVHNLKNQNVMIIVKL